MREARGAIKNEIAAKAFYDIMMYISI